MAVAVSVLLLAPLVGETVSHDALEVTVHEIPDVRVTLDVPAADDTVSAVGDSVSVDGPGVTRMEPTIPSAVIESILTRVA